MQITARWFGSTGTSSAPGDSILEFVDQDHLSVHNNDGMVLHFHREQPWHPETADIARLVGDYQGQEALVTYSVRLDSDRLIATPVGRPEAAVTLRPLIANTFVFGDDGQGLVHFSPAQAWRSLPCTCAGCVCR